MWLDLQYEINFIVVVSRTWSNPIYLSLVSDDHEHCIDNKPHVSRPKSDIRLSSIEQSCYGSSRPTVRSNHATHSTFLAFGTQGRWGILKPIPIGISAADAATYPNTFTGENIILTSEQTFTRLCESALS